MRVRIKGSYATRKSSEIESAVTPKFRILNPGKVHHLTVANCQEKENSKSMQRVLFLQSDPSGRYRIPKP